MYVSVSACTVVYYRVLFDYSCWGQGCNVVVLECGLWLGQAGRWAVGLAPVDNRKSKKEIQNGRATAALPPYRIYTTLHGSSIDLHGNVVGRASHPLSPASPQCVGGARVPG